MNHHVFEWHNCYGHIPWQYEVTFVKKTTNKFSITAEIQELNKEKTC